MIIATRCHKTLNSAIAWDPTPYESKELSLHNRFAKAAGKVSDIEHTYELFKIMRMECARLGLRACGFRQFCNRVNASHSVHSETHPISTDYPTFWPENSRAPDFKTLLSSLDYTSGEH